MKALAVLALLLGVLAVLSPAPQTDSIGTGARSIALNYAIFRNAAFLHAFKHRANGPIAQADLDLPTEWHALRYWTARIEGGRCYVYGPASAEEISAVRDIFQGSLAVGRASDGRLVPDGLTPLPEFIPSGSLVSVIEVR